MNEQQSMNDELNIENENISEPENLSENESVPDSPTVINNSYNYYLSEPDLQAIRETVVAMQKTQSAQYEHYVAHASSVETLLTGILIACGLVFGGLCVLVFGGGSHAHK